MTARWPLPPDEDVRVQTVRRLQLLDTPPEERFDRITRLASRVLSVPVALVSLLDDRRQWFKSNIGYPGSELPLAETICGYAVATDHRDLLLIEDATTDPRFAGLPGVVGPPHVRAYGGKVLRVADRPVGTLCVLDHQPRQFADDELAALVDLAYWAEAELRSDEDRRIARDLDALQRRTELVLDGVADGVVGVDREGVVTFTNRAAAGMLGWAQEELLGRNLHAVTHSRRADGSPFPVSLCPVTEVLGTGASRRLLHDVFWRRDGTPLPADWSVGAVVEGDDVVGAVVVFGDASRRLHVERMKDEFTSVVSHELRTPLTSMKGALQLLAGGSAGELPDRAEPLMDIALRNADRLARLVDDILDLDRSTSGRMQLSPELLEVVHLMATAASTVRGTAVERGIRLEIEPVGATVWGDEHRLLQVLTNLLGNAMRFSPTGSVVRLHAAIDEETDTVTLAVTDEGVGIPAEALPRVFDRFWQVDPSSRRTRGGSGLGLAIAKSIVEAHGGTVDVESEVGRGSTFTVRLPLSAGPEGADASIVEEGTSA